MVSAQPRRRRQGFHVVRCLEALAVLEAVRGAYAEAAAYADQLKKLKAPELTAIIDHANSASIRVAEKSGFSIREEARYRGAPILLFRRRAGGVAGV